MDERGNGRVSGPIYGNLKDTRKKVSIISLMEFVILESNHYLWREK